MDKYTVVRKIGQGSYGNVLLLRCKKNRKKYVLKKINLHNLTNKDLRATHQEVHLLAFLHHPNIVSYKDAFKTKEGFLYIIMLYCDGGDMFSKIKNQQGIYFPENQITQWIIQMCLALQYLHDKNILHRDLKTRNIFLSKNNVVKIGDFGIARILQTKDSMASTMTGTPYYMSPEMFSKKSYNYKSDVWSLGCCVYEIAALRHAFYASDIASLALKILRGKLPIMPSHYSRELKELTSSLLQLEPKRRPSPVAILTNPFIDKHIKMFLIANKPSGLSAIGGTNILRNCQHKNINKNLLNRDNEDQLIQEGQGLSYQTDQQNRIKNDEFTSGDRNLVISGQEMKLGNRDIKQDSPKLKSKHREIANLNLNRTRSSAFNHDSDQNQPPIKLLPTKIKAANAFFTTSRTKSSINPRSNTHTRIPKKIRKEKSSDKIIKKKSEDITCMFDILEKIVHRSQKSNIPPAPAKKLQTQIADLRHDCRRGLGQDVLIRALQLINQFDSKSLEASLIELLGKENYINYVGKIWQLKFCEDSILSTNDSYM